MLYEMVCGRPPFVGDESVAIIGQHLNTPPVAPSWHRPDCPPALEALILRLLEKDPSKRPASAAEVREALENVATPVGAAREQPLHATSAEAAPFAAHDPLYRGAFVGREQELRQLRDAYEAAVSGQGNLAVVVGEPGIGKTALCEQLATYVAMRGGKALVGHCYEEGSLSLPYLAFVEALRTYVLAREPEGLRSDLGSAGPEVARIVSEIRDRADVQPSAASGDPEDDRWRLLQAVTSFLRNASSVQPLLIVLEDLHWSDRGTLDLMLHVARNLQGARLLIIGTYRDVEVDRAHPLSSTLAELRRVGALPRVLLRGLLVDEVHRMMIMIRGQDLPLSRAEAIHRQTEGNPLFVQEVLRYIVEEGLLVREGGRFVASEDYTADRIPDGLRDVVGKRLNRLSERTNQVLSIAAVMGREFRLDVLQQVSGLPEEEVVAALEEANERAVVEQRQAPGAIAFRFTHAFFRSTLYEEMFAPRRIRLHQQVGRALEQAYSRRLDEHAAELAEHFAQSTEREDLEKALHYCELAAQRAMSVFAYGEAERHLQQALRALEVLDPDDRLKRCDLLLALGEAMLPQESPGRVAGTAASEAFTLAEAEGDDSRAARAAVQALEAYQRGSLEWNLPGFGEWTERADRYAQPGTAERVYADMGMSRHVNVTRGPASGHVLNRRAIEHARGLTDPAPFFFAAGYALTGMTSLGDRALISSVVEDIIARPHERVRSRDLGVCLLGATTVLLARGERAAAEALSSSLAQLAERTGDATIASLAMVGPILLALIDGRLEDAVALHYARRAHAIERQVSGVNSGRGLGRPPLYLGRAAEFLSEFENPTRAVQAARALFLAYLGRLDEAQAIAKKFPDVGKDNDESGTHVIVNLLETAILCADRPTTQSLMRRLEPFSDAAYFGNDGMGVSFGRLLGDGARLCGQADDARGYYAKALEFCAKIRFRPETAVVRLDLAELLLEHYPDERDAAIEHLDFAIGEFREMKMQPSLERALRHRGLLKA
jgi:tetratricopeptide (TPR) repeat protein